MFSIKMILLERKCNFSLQCNQVLDINYISEKYKIDFKNYFKKEIQQLAKKQDLGMLNLNNDYIKVTTYGRYFVRHICQIFDTFLIIIKSMKYMVIKI